MAELETDRFRPRGTELLGEGLAAGATGASMGAVCFLSPYLSPPFFLRFPYVYSFGMCGSEENLPGAGGFLHSTMLVLGSRGPQAWQQGPLPLSYLKGFLPPPPSHPQTCGNSPTSAFPVQRWQACATIASVTKFFTWILTLLVLGLASDWCHRMLHGLFLMASLSLDVIGSFSLWPTSSGFQNGTLAPGSIHYPKCTD